jgi:hypothetical protein
MTISTNNYPKDISNLFISLFAGSFVGIGTAMILAVPSVLAQTTIKNIPVNQPKSPSALPNNPINPSPSSPNGFPSYQINPSNPNTNVSPTNPTNPSPNGFPTYQINPNPENVTLPNNTNPNGFPNNQIILNNQNVDPSNEGNQSTGVIKR